MRLFLEPHNCFILTCILIKPSFRISTGVPSPLINKGGVKSSELIYFVHIQLDWKWCDESCIHKKLPWLFPFIFLSVFSQQPCMHHAWMYNNNNNNCAYCLVGLWFDRLNYKRFNWQHIALLHHTWKHVWEVDAFEEIHNKIK